MIEDNLYDELVGIINGTAFNTTCAKCIAATEVMHVAAITQPVSTITSLLIRVCDAEQYEISASSCEQEYSGRGGCGYPDSYPSGNSVNAMKGALTMLKFWRK